MGMTFSKEVKEELSKIIPKARHCRIAEYAVLFWHFGEIVTENGCRRLIISCEQEMIARKCFTLTEKTFNIICIVLGIIIIIYYIYRHIIGSNVVDINIKNSLIYRFINYL